MKHCPLCKEQYPDESVFCGNDGTRLEPAAARRCGSCGEPLEVGANFCPECGAPYRDQGFADSPPSTEAEPEASPSFGAATEEHDKETFEARVAAAIRSSFPDAVVRERFRTEANGTEIVTDLLVVDRTGIFLIECQDYRGKIRGSLAYDYRRGEVWTCRTPSGRIVQIPSDGKNPARQALDVLSALRERASAAASHIHSVLVFPDGADLSGIEGMPVSPAKPLRDPGVSALTLADLYRHIAAGEGNMNPREAIGFIDAARIPKTVVSQTTAPLRTEGGKRSFKEGIRPVYVIGGAAALAVILLAALVLQFLPPWISKAPEVAQKSDGTAEGSPTSHTGPDTPAATEAAPATKMTEAVTPNPASSPPPSGVVTREATRPLESKSPVEVVKRTDQPAKTKPEFVKKESSPPQASKRAEIPPSSGEAPIPRRAAEAGTYETIKTTAARMGPSDSSDIVDQLKTGTRLNVTGSHGEWLVVRSKTRNRTVYVKRDDAMLLPDRDARGASAVDSELRWKEVGNQIQQAIAQRGITGVTVSFVGDTAYLRGRVDTEDQRHSAEQAARSMPEVIHVHNGIWLNR
jgi:hypothetical protein